MCRPKHRNDYNHGKCGFVGGNPRYSKKDRLANRVELEVEVPEPYVSDDYESADWDYLDGLSFDYLLEMNPRFEDDDLHLDHDDLEDLSCFEDDDLPVEPMLMSFGRNSIEEGGMFYEGYWS